jgi:hypothetical protein
MRNKNKIAQVLDDEERLILGPDRILNGFYGGFAKVIGSKWNLGWIEEERTLNPSWLCLHQGPSCERLL